MLKEMENNPDLVFKDDGTIGVVSIVYKGKYFQINWSVYDYTDD
jgi:hypothetical protein